MLKRILALALCLALLCGGAALADEPFPDTCFTFPVNSDSIQAEADGAIGGGQAPSVEAFAEKYFGVLSNLEFGTAGASLKSAQAASEVCAFAVENGLWDPEMANLRDNMLAAFGTMDEDSRSRFQEGFDAVRTLLDDCLENYDANRAVFDDAGEAEAMDQVMNDPQNRLAWENLRDNTLALLDDQNAG